MNTFGNKIRLQIFGESHGQGVGAILDGIPAGLEISEDDFAEDLKRRTPDIDGITSRREPDKLRILSGLYKGHTTGAPLCFFIPNIEIQSRDYSFLEHSPRPGHTDWVASQKFHNFNDPRGGGMFSGRITVALVVAGHIAKRLCAPAQFHAEFIEPQNFAQKLENARSQGDSLGGIVRCTITDLPASLGEPFFDSCESLLAHAIFAIPGITGVSFGEGFAAAQMTGSQYNDRFCDQQGHTFTNHAGGINGGITNGNPVIINISVRPPSSISMPQQTCNMQTGKVESLSIGGRHDVCFARRVPVIIEACAALVFADLISRR